MSVINTTDGFVSAQQTVSNTALSLADFTGFSQENVDNAEKLYLTVNDSNSIRLSYVNGVTPTTTVGHLIDNTFELYGNLSIQNLRVIRNGANDCEIYVTLER